MVLFCHHMCGHNVLGLGLKYKGGSSPMFQSCKAYRQAITDTVSVGT